MGDINGDGFADVFLVNKNGAGINAYVARGGTSGLGGFTPLNGLWTNAFDPATTRTSMGDINGDGFADVFLVNKNGAGINAYVARGGTSGLGGFTPLNGLWTNAFDPATTRTSMGDINGDGFADVFLVNKNGAGINAYVARGGTSGLGGFTPLNGLWTNAFDPATTRTSMGDINGDGFADVFLVNKNGAGINAYVARGGTSGLGASPH